MKLLIKLKKLKNLYVDEINTKNDYFFMQLHWKMSVGKYKNM